MCDSFAESAVQNAYIFALRKLRNRKVLGACTTVRNGAHISYSESCLRCPALYLVFSLDPLAARLMLA